MKKILFCLWLCLLCIPTFSLQASSPLPWNDVYYQRREKTPLLGPEEAETTCFYGLKIGDDKAVVLKKLQPAFHLLYELKTIGPAYLLADTVYPDYYLTVQFDSQNKVSLISYQKNVMYHID